MTLTKGSKAYYDTFAGLIPCKVLSITGESGIPSSRQSVRFRITTGKFERYGYKRGEVIETWSLHVPPREAIRFKDYSARIGHYDVEVDA